MVPGGRPASISEQQALVHRLSIDGPAVLDGGLLPAVTGQDRSGCACESVIDTLNAPDTFIYMQRSGEGTVCVPPQPPSYVWRLCLCLCACDCG